MLDFAKDVQRGLRHMAKEPSFTLIVTLTLALGIGAVSAVFSVVDALVLRPFPIPAIERLVMLFETVPSRGEDRNGIAPANYLDWTAETKALDEVVAFEWWDVNLTGGDVPERLQGTLVTPGFFELLGVETPVGRNLAAERGRERDRPRTAVISHQLWSRRFAGDPAVVGSSLLLDGERYDVVGVAERGFAYPFGTDVWAPLWFDAKTAADRDAHYLEAIGRLAPGATVSDVRAELAVIAQRLEQEHPESNRGRGVHVLSLSRAVVDIGAPAFLAVWQTATVFVLLIACVNVANLLFARGNERQKELSLQLALGAGRGRVVRQLLTESVLLALLGAVAALPLAWIGVELLRTNMPAHIQRFVVGWDQIDLDARVLGFTTIVAMLTAIVFGLLPALQASRTDLTSALKEGGRGGSGGRRQRGRHLLVIGEIALALTLLVASGLSIQGTLRMLNEPQGYDLDRLMTMSVTLPGNVYETEEARRRFHRELLERVRALPQVRSAAIVNILPSSGNGHSRPVDIEGRTIVNVSERPLADYRVASEGYFETMRIPLVRGRLIGSEDREDTARVAVVSERFVEDLWPGEDGLGKRFRAGLEAEAPWITVVGVVGDVIHDWFLQGPQRTFYLPLRQEPRHGVHLAVRTTGEPEAIVPAIRAELRRVDPDQPIFNVRSMRRILSERLIGPKYAASMMGVFGAIALVLAAVGIYGLMAYSVSRRTREIGLRVALGAAGGDVLRLTLAQAIRVTAIGVAAGLVLSYLAGQVMASTLHGVVRLDAVTYAALSVTLAAISLVAGYVPARRALRIDPAIALRVE